jgi:calcineurin-like phosphoesterase family protein
MIYFTADTHFGHVNVIKMSNRPFADINEMNKTLITNWNSLVSDRDEIYILGDFLFKSTGLEAKRILQKLNGKKYLVKGNHEKYLSDPDFDESLFEWVKDYHVLDYKDSRFILFHYPILEWQFYHRKSAHLYGHVHNNVSHIQEETNKFRSWSERAINVGVDVNNYFPVSAEDVYNRAFRDTEN